MLPGQVKLIPRKQFVAAIAGQAYRDSPARQFRHQIGRQLRRIGERLIVERGQPRNQVERVSRIQKQLGMLELKWSDIGFNLEQQQVNEAQILVQKIEDITRTETFISLQESISRPIKIDEK